MNLSETTTTRPGAYVAGAAALAVTVALVVLGVTGELAPASDVLADPGVIARWGLPAARAVHDLAAAVSIGLLVLTAFVVAPEPGSAHPEVVTGVRRRMLRTATAALVVWLVSSGAVLALTAADVSGFPVGSPGSGSILYSFVSQIDLGRALGVSLLVVAVCATVAAMAIRVTTVAWAAALALFALLPLSLAGHAAGSANHMNSVDSLALHLLSVTVWVGGLAGLLLYARVLGSQLSTVVGRYSNLAAVCFAVVALSGVVNAGLRLGSFGALASTYGLLVVGKAVALLALGVAGYLHRRTTIPRLAGSRAMFARLAAVELLVMGAAMGLAVALSRSAPPAPELAEDPVASLLGYPVPPPVTVSNYISAFYPDLLWLSIAIGMLSLYAAGLVRLRRRGDRWPLQRTIFWGLGTLALVFVTSGGPAVYGRIHFSTHMIQHMSLMVVVPFLLVFGAPVTLAMRTLTARTDGSFGFRELLLALVHSRFLKLLGHPVTAAVLFTGSLTVFYYSDLFRLAMFTHAGHVLMTAHFLLSGYLFVWALVGIDPGPERPPYPFRLVLLLMTLGFHAFFGTSLMASNTVLAPDWWHSLGQRDDVALLADQQTGGAIAWSAGDIPSLLLVIALLVGWVRSDARTTRQLDRKADRDGDADLRRYNEQLAAMSRPTTPTDRRPG